jgi:phosphoribosylanthranilate isomerase
VIRAARLAAAGPPAEALREALAWVGAAAAAGRAPALVLVDAGAAGRADQPGAALGGTGRTVDWDRLARAASPGVPVALAGGLTPANVAAAIRATGITAVDTASGVESAPGRKDRDLVTAFVREALAAIRGERGSRSDPAATPDWG